MKRPMILAIIVTGALFCSAAASGEQGKPLRHLVYKVGVNVSTQTDELVMGNNGWRPTASSGVAHYTGGILSQGTMTVDIIGFTTDNDAFAVQISEQTDNRKAPPVRVDVTFDGALRIQPDDFANVTTEERALLRLLARKFLSQDGLQAGKWVHELAEQRMNIRDEYSVTGVKPNGDVNIALDERIKVAGAQPFDTTTHGTITYSSTYKVPRAITIDGRTHHEGLQQTDTQDMKVYLDLISDSFEPGT